MLHDIQLHLVDDVETADAFLRWLGERRPGIVAFDTETTGLDWWTRDFVRMIQFGDAQQGWSIPYRNWRGVAELALRRYDGPLVAHNLKFDLHALDVSGLPMPSLHRLHDTMVLDHLSFPARAHGLKPMASRMFGSSAVVGQNWLKHMFAKHGWDWSTVPEDLLAYWGYAALDTSLTAAAFDLLMPEIVGRGLLPAYEREMAYVGVMYRSEKRGLLIDPTYTLGLYDAWGAEIDQLRESLRLRGIENPSSGAQVAKALERDGWDPEEFTETGLPKTSEEVLRGIMTEMGVNADIARDVLRYRRLVKWSKAYLERFLTKADENWRVHPSINTLAARTGRSSVTGPPLQTLPRGPEIRHCILPNEGETLYAVDYDAQELRLFAHYSAEPRMIQAFKDGMDPHKLTASMVYGVAPEDVVKSQRDTAKNTRYARLYGAGPAKIAATASASTVSSGGQPVTEGEIRAFIARLEQEFPGEAEFTRTLDVLARTRLAEEGIAYVWTWGGRFMPSDPDKTYSLLNYLIQGSAADLLKHKVVLLDAMGYGDWIMVPVHDELLFSVPAGFEGEMTKIRAAMEEHEEFLCPLTCETSGPFSTWGYKYVKG